MNTETPRTAKPCGAHFFNYFLCFVFASASFFCSITILYLRFISATVSSHVIYKSRKAPSRTDSYSSRSARTCSIFCAYASGVGSEMNPLTLSVTVADVAESFKNTVGRCCLQLHQRIGVVHRREQKQLRSCVHCFQQFPIGNSSR